jgi:hypothetical protein
VDKRLSKLNFSEIISYPEISGYKVEDKHNFKCKGFCISCEKNKILQRGESLTLISHGADSSDYKKRIKKEYTNVYPIMFVFENPGKENYGWSEKKSFTNNIIKSVPTKHYYWVRDDIKEPIHSLKELEKIEGHKYDPYLVYLQEKHNLGNIYVTNLTKCLLRNKKDLSLTPDYKCVREHCIGEIFKKELEIFKPRIIFCMGTKVKKWFPYSSFAESKERVVKLYHPAARMSFGKIVKENDRLIAKAINRALSLDLIDFSDYPFGENRN